MTFYAFKIYCDNIWYFPYVSSFFFRKLPLGKKGGFNAEAYRFLVKNHMEPAVRCVLALKFFLYVLRNIVGKCMMAVME